jgi:hypothetical protein
MSLYCGRQEGIFFILQVIYEHGGQRWNNIDRGNRRTQNNLSQRYLVHDKSHMAGQRTRNQAFPMTGRQQTAWAMTQPVCSLEVLQVIFFGSSFPQVFYTSCRWHFLIESHWKCYKTCIAWIYAPLSEIFSLYLLSSGSSTLIWITI